MKNEYNELKGTEVEIINLPGLVEAWGDNKCFVAEIDPDVGITIVHLGTGKKAFCLNCDKGNGRYKEKFEYIVKGIKEGVLDQEAFTNEFHAMDKIFWTIAGGSNMVSCAFE